MNRLLTLLLLFCLTSAASAEDYIDKVKVGNEAYQKQEYKQALEAYKGAEVEIPGLPELEYNMAGALYQQGSYEETVDKYTKALNSTDVVLEAKAHYNLGNTYYRMNDFEKAIGSYQNALKIDPGDLDAKYNLELARRMLKEQTKPEQEQPQEDQQQQEKEEQDQQQQNQDQQNEDQENQQQQEQQEEKQPQDQQQQPEPSDDKDMDREDAERILNALRDDEQDLQKKIKRSVKAAAYTGKDW